MITLDNGGAARRSIRIVEPLSTQRGIVDFIWIDEAPARSVSWRIVADDAPHIIYSRYATAGSSASRLHIVGARSSFVDIDSMRRIVSIGVRLAPGALPAVARVAAGDLTDRTLPLEWFAGGAIQMQRRLDALDASESDDTIALLVATLIGARREPHPRIKLLDEMGSVGHAAHAAGISERAFNTWSHQHLGLGSRRYLRIRRLHRALDLRQRNGLLTWSQIATTTGYADQSHFVRDCRDLLGESPSAFTSRAAL